MIELIQPEGEDERVLTAATQLQATDYVTPIVLGDETKVQSLTFLPESLSFNTFNKSAIMSSCNINLINHSRYNYLKERTNVF
jgi:phosphotransacetylase